MGCVINFIIECDKFIIEKSHYIIENKQFIIKKYNYIIKTMFSLVTIPGRVLSRYLSSIQ